MQEKQRYYLILFLISNYLILCIKILIPLVDYNNYLLNWRIQFLIFIVIAELLYVKKVYNIEKGFFCTNVLFCGHEPLFINSTRYFNTRICTLLSLFDWITLFIKGRMRGIWLAWFHIKQSHIDNQNSAPCFCIHIVQCRTNKDVLKLILGREVSLHHL